MLDGRGLDDVLDHECLQRVEESALRHRKPHFEHNTELYELGAISPPHCSDEVLDQSNNEILAGITIIEKDFYHPGVDVVTASFGMSR